MQPNTSPPPVVPFAWAEVLENVEKTLARAEADAARSEQALISLDCPDPAATVPSWQTALDRLEERFRQLQGCIAEGDLNATQAEKSLEQSEETIKRWVVEAEAMRRRLANGAASPVS